MEMQDRVDLLIDQYLKDKEAEEIAYKLTPQYQIDLLIKEQNARKEITKNA